MDNIKELALRGKTGDEYAKVELIELLKPIRKYLVGRYSSPADRDDDEQELVIVLLNSLSTYDENEASFQWYVKQKSKYHILAKFKRKTEVLLEDELSDVTPVMETIIDESVDVELDILNKELNEFLIKCIGELSKLQKDIIILKFYEFKTGVEISKILNVSEATVSRELKRGLKKLRRKLNDYR